MAGPAPEPALVLTLKFVLPVILLLHLVTSYVYLGKSPVWDFIATTARGLLALLRWLPLRVGKLDLGPLAAIVLILRFYIGCRLSWRRGVLPRGPSDAGLSLRRGRGQTQRDGGAGMGLAFYGQCAAVQFGQALRNAEAQAQTLLFVQFAIELHVSAHPGDVLGRKPAPVVATDNMTAAPASARRDGHGRAAGSENLKAF